MGRPRRVVAGPETAGGIIVRAGKVPGRFREDPGRTLERIIRFLLEVILSTVQYILTCSVWGRFVKRSVVIELCLLYCFAKLVFLRNSDVNMV